MRIDEIGTVQLGRQRSPKNRSAEYPTKYLRAANITERGLDLSDVLEMDFKPAERQRYELRAGDIILSEASGSPSQVGKPAIWNDELPLCCFQNTVIRLRPKHASSRYLFWLFTHFYRSGLFAKVAGGVGINHLSAAKFSQIAAPIPPLEEQQQIVVEIEQQFTRLDAGVASLKRVQAALKRYRASVLKAACEGRLVPTEAELARRESRPYENATVCLASILKERRAKWNGHRKYGEPGMPRHDELPRLPEGWIWATTEQTTSLVGTGATPYRGNTKYWKSGTIPWITSGALNQKDVYSASELITPLAIKETNAKLFPPGTLLLALYGEGKTRGKVSELRIEAATNQACAALLFDTFNSVLRPYLRLFFEKNYEDIRRLSSGGVQPNLSLSIIKQTPIPLPPLAEQHRIVAEEERLLSVIEGVECVVTANLQRAKMLRQSILEKAFSGKLLAPVPLEPYQDVPNATVLKK